jgi:ribosomal protein S18 acetylase RimI-like enzyme
VSIFAGTRTALNPPSTSPGEELHFRISHRTRKEISPDISIVGFAVLALLIDHCELCNLVVRPAYLSKQVGYLCCNNVSRLLRTATSSRIFLEVRQSNHRAIAFYERNGLDYLSEEELLS